MRSVVEEIVLPSLTLYIDVDRHMKSSNISYLDAMIHWCLENDIEIEHVASLLQSNNVAIAKLRCDAEKLNFLKKEIRVPI